MKNQNLPETLDVFELMEVKGGGQSIHGSICIAASAIKCTVAGAGVIILPQPPAPPAPPVK